MGVGTGSRHQVPPAVASGVPELHSPLVREGRHTRRHLAACALALLVICVAFMAWSLCYAVRQASEHAAHVRQIGLRCHMDHAVRAYAQRVGQYPERIAPLIHNLSMEIGTRLPEQVYVAHELRGASPFSPPRGPHVVLMYDRDLRWYGGHRGRFVVLENGRVMWLRSEDFIRYLRDLVRAISRGEIPGAEGPYLERIAAELARPHSAGSPEAAKE